MVTYIKSKETNQTSYKWVDKSDFTDLETTYFWQAHEPSYVAIKPKVRINLSLNQ